MAHVESNVVVGRPVAEVFAGLLDLENSERFDPGVESVRKTTEGPIGVGTTFEFRERVPPRGKLGHGSATYTGVEPNRRIEFVMTVGRLGGSGAFSFAPEPGGTRVTFRGSVVPPRLLRIFTPLVARQAQKTWDQRLGWIRDWLETPAAEASDETGRRDTGR